MVYDTLSTHAVAGRLGGLGDDYGYEPDLPTYMSEPAPTTETPISVVTLPFMIGDNPTPTTAPVSATGATIPTSTGSSLSDILKTIMGAGTSIASSALASNNANTTMKTGTGQSVQKPVAVSGQLISGVSNTTLAVGVIAFFAFISYMNNR